MISIMIHNCFKKIKSGETKQEEAKQLQNAFK